MITARVTYGSAAVGTDPMAETIISSDRIEHIQKQAENWAQAVDAGSRPCHAVWFDFENGRYKMTFIKDSELFIAFIETGDIEVDPDAWQVKLMAHGINISQTIEAGNATSAKNKAMRWVRQNYEVKPRARWQEHRGLFDRSVDLKDHPSGYLQLWREADRMPQLGTFVPGAII